MNHIKTFEYEWSVQIYVRIARSQSSMTNWVGGLGFTQTYVNVCLPVRTNESRSLELLVDVCASE